MSPSDKREFIPTRIAVLTVSDSRTEADDRSGNTLVRELTDAGHSLVEKIIVPDDIYRIRAAISNWIADSDVQVIAPRGTIRDRLDRRVRSMTVRPCHEGAIDALRSVKGVVQVESAALSLEELFKDVVLGAEANI